MTEPKLPRDALGIQVPGRLADVFFGRRRMTDWCSRLMRLRGELSAMSAEPFANHLPLNEMQKQLDAVRIEVLLAAPFALCDCRARERDCPLCNGNRWISGKQSLTESPPKAT